MGAQWKAKHKDLASNAKGRLFGKLAKDIMIAARAGADPKDNAKLRMVVEQARKVVDVVFDVNKTARRAYNTGLQPHTAPVNVDLFVTSDAAKVTAEPPLKPYVYAKG